LPQEGVVRKIRKEKKKTKEGGLSPQEGDVRKRRKEKKKTMEGKKVAPAKARFHVLYTENFFFFVHEYLGLEAARLGRSIGSYETWSTRKPCAKKVPETKRTTLRSKSSTLKGLLYAPIKRVQYHKRTTLRRLKSCCKASVARKVRTIALEQSVSKKAVF
jgi:hypothetical protein